jgi:hypothetical protein
MKINEKLRLYLMDEIHFISLLFTLETTRRAGGFHRSASGGLLRPRHPPEADMVYRNGFVYTVDMTRSRAEAFAVKDDKYIAVGSNDDMKAVTGPETKVLKTVLKGHAVYEGK